MKKLRRLFTDDKGNVLVLFALSLTMLIAITALVVDGGRLYHERSVLQNAMDAAVLGGAQGLLVNKAEAETISKVLAERNSFVVNDSDMTTSSTSANSNLTIDTTYVEASRTSTVSPIFAKIIGINSVDVEARAKAIISPLLHGEGITPIAVEKSAIPTNKLNCENTGTYSGNCGFVRVDGANGTNDLKNAIISGAEYTVGENPDTEPGNPIEPIRKAVKDLISQDAAKPYCQTAEEAAAAEDEGKECARLITVLVVETLNLSGSKQVTVIGFADYYLLGMADVEENADGTETITYDPNKGNQIIGEFVRTRNIDDVAAGTGSYEDYLVQGVKLVE